ncbi:MAG: MotA/TolQ/ExbB proton channel family protein [Pseudomonadota bacterium]
MDWLSQTLSSLDLTWAQQLIDGGGPVVLVLAAMSVVCLTTVIAKGLQFLWLGVGSGRGHQSAMTHWIAGEDEQATRMLAAHRSPTSKVLLHAMNGISDGRDENVVREDAERLAGEALLGLRSRLRIIELTAQIAPLLGLFGTVIGMMGAFQALQSAGSDADPAALAGGIWVALITTAVGLAVAMPAAAVSYWFEGRLDRERTILETALTAVFTKRLLGGAAHRADAQRTGPYQVWSAPDEAG